MSDVTVDLYQEKLGLFRTLRQLTDEIAKFTPEQLVREDEAYQRLTELLDERDELMEKIDRLDQGIGRQPQQGDSTAVQQELRAEMLRLQEQNEVVEKVLQSSLAQLRGQAKKIQDGRHSNRAYLGGAPSVEGSFIDKRR
jgi:flagellar biosynthesis/type III secretory pathway chaperone